MLNKKQSPRSKLQEKKMQKKEEAASASVSVDERIKTSDLVDNSNEMIKSNIGNPKQNKKEEISEIIEPERSDEKSKSQEKSVTKSPKKSPEKEVKLKEKSPEKYNRTKYDRIAYLNSRKNELHSYEKKLKSEYQAHLNSYKRFKNTFKEEMKREYERKIGNKINYLENEYETKLQHTIQDYEIQTQEGSESQERFKKQIKNDYKNQIFEEEQRLDYKIDDIKREKQSLIDEIDIFQKIQEQTQSSVNNSELSEVKNLLEEKFECEKSNFG